MAELVEALSFFLNRRMPFWAYMLHCADRTFYTGHTDDLVKRIGQHEQGLIPGYTSLRRPVKLVWSDVFATRHEAREAEQRLKGWGQAKKLALIRGDWDRISALAKGKEGASTSSAKPVVGWLHPHLDLLPSEPFALETIARPAMNGLRLRFRLTGPIDILRVPRPNEPKRTEGLWQSLCFEAFVRLRDEPAYFEINLSPSRQWAVYRFDAQREGMTPVDILEPRIKVDKDRYSLEMSAILQLPADLGGANVNLAAVIEEKSGHKSYWALAHPVSGPPDFHDPACFVLKLPPPPLA